jgi:hypothetical protein
LVSENEISLDSIKNDCFCFNQNENKFIIKIPSTAKKEDLFELKDFLSQEKY